MNAPVATLFTTYACEKLDENLRQLERCANLLSTEQLWSRPNSHCNSVGNLLLHLTGNVRQWIGAGLGDLPENRDRQGEFDHRDPLPADRLLPPLRRVVEHAQQIIRELDAPALAAEHTIQQYPVTGVVAVFHVVEHFSFHTGQVVHITKILRDTDLSLYDERGHRRDGAQTP